MTATKYDSYLLQNATGFLLQNATILLQNVIVQNIIMLYQQTKHVESKSSGQYRRISTSFRRALLL